MPYLKLQNYIYIYMYIYIVRTSRRDRCVRPSVVAVVDLSIRPSVRPVAVVRPLSVRPRPCELLLLSERDHISIRNRRGVTDVIGSWTQLFAKV